MNNSPSASSGSSRRRRSEPAPTKRIASRGPVPSPTSNVFPEWVSTSSDPCLTKEDRKISSSFSMTRLAFTPRVRSATVEPLTTPHLTLAAAFRSRWQFRSRLSCQHGAGLGLTRLDAQRSAASRRGVANVGRRDLGLPRASPVPSGQFSGACDDLAGLQYRVDFVHFATRGGGSGGRDDGFGFLPTAPAGDSCCCRAPSGGRHRSM